MGSRLTSLALIALLAVASPAASADSQSPTPQATVSATATATATATPSTKATAAASTKATAKPKPTPAKKTVVKKKRAKVRISPSPKPVWPPKGFSVESEVYAKVPTAKELVGLISANKTLQKRIKECTTYICGSIQVVSEMGCIWWEVISVVSDGRGTKLGELTSAFSASGAKEFKTLIIISPESADLGGVAKISSVICHREARVTTDPTNNYKKVTQ